jgi:4'-phosphopantetheinyl transferase
MQPSDGHGEWPQAPTQPSLADHEVHVWSVSLDVGANEDWLSQDEKLRASRFRFERDRTRYLVRRTALRALIGRYTGVPPWDIAFEYSDRGKPRLAPRLETRRLSFNLSHSHDLALLAFTRHSELGLDVERLRPLDDAMAIARRFFSPAENAALNKIAPELRREAFFTCWTRKEAFVKATGEGLQRPLDSFDVSLAPNEPARLLRVSGGDSSAWSLYHLQPTEGFIGALAVRSRPSAVRRWTVGARDLLV